MNNTPPYISKFSQFETSTINRFPMAATTTKNTLECNTYPLQHKTTIPKPHETLKNKRMKQSHNCFSSYHPPISSTNNFVAKSNFQSGRPLSSSSDGILDMKAVSQPNTFYSKLHDQNLQNENYFYNGPQYDEEQPRPKNFYPTPHPYPHSSNSYGYPPLSVSENCSTAGFAYPKCSKYGQQRFITTDKNLSSANAHNLRGHIMNHDTILPFIQMTYSSLLSYFPSNTETIVKGVNTTNLSSNSQSNGSKRAAIPLMLKSFMKDEEHHIPNEIQSLLQFICPSKTDFYYLCICPNVNDSTNEKPPNIAPSSCWMANMQDPQTQFTANDGSGKDFKRKLGWLSFLPRISLSIHPENPTQENGATLSSYPHNQDETATISTKLSFTDQAITIFRAEALVPISQFQISFISIDEMKENVSFICGNDWGQNSMSGILWCDSTKRQIGVWISESFCFFNKSTDENFHSVTYRYDMLSKNPFLYACCIFYKMNYHNIDDFFYLLITKTSVKNDDQGEENLPHIGFKVTSPDLSSLDHKQKDLVWKFYDYEADFVMPETNSDTNPQKAMSGRSCNDEDGFINGQFREVIKENKPVCYNSSQLSFMRNMEYTNAPSYPPSNISIKENEHDNLYETIAKQKHQIKSLESQIKELICFVKSQQGISEDIKLKLASFENQIIITNKSSMKSKKAQNDRSIKIASPSYSSTKEDTISKLSNSPASFFDQSNGDFSENVLSTAPDKQGKWIEQNKDKKQRRLNDCNSEKSVKKIESMVTGMNKDKSENDNFKCEDIDFIINGLDELSTIQRIEVNNYSVPNILH